MHFPSAAETHIPIQKYFVRSFCWGFMLFLHERVFVYGTQPFKIYKTSTFNKNRVQKLFQYQNKLYVLIYELQKFNVVVIKQSRKCLNQNISQCTQLTSNFRLFSSILQPQTAALNLCYSTWLQYKYYKHAHTYACTYPSTTLYVDQQILFSNRLSNWFQIITLQTQRDVPLCYI